MRGVDQRIFGVSAADPLEKPKGQLPTETLLVFWQYIPNGSVHSKIIKNNTMYQWRQLHCNLLTQGNNMIALNIAYR